MRFSVQPALALLALCLITACSSQPKDLPPPPPEAKDAPPTVKTAEVAAASTFAPKLECSTKGDTRSLELRAKGKGCELAYTKNGQEGIVATSANGSSHCENTMKKISERLKGSGFECK